MSDKKILQVSPFLDRDVSMLTSYDSSISDQERSRKSTINISELYVSFHSLCEFFLIAVPTDQHDQFRRREPTICLHLRRQDDSSMGLRYSSRDQIHRRTDYALDARCRNASYRSVIVQPAVRMIDERCAQVNGWLCNRSIIKFSFSVLIRLSKMYVTIPSPYIHLPARNAATEYKTDAFTSNSERRDSQVIPSQDTPANRNSPPTVASSAPEMDKEIWSFGIGKLVESPRDSKRIARSLSVLLGCLMSRFVLFLSASACRADDVRCCRVNSSLRLGMD